MKMNISLNQPGMTSLHKAGLAGLYMTLKAFERKNITISDLHWSLYPGRVELDWLSGDATASLKSFIEQSFRLEDGFVILTGLEMSGPLSLEKKHHLYEAMLNSFLQFGPHRPTGSKTALTYEVDDQVFWIKDFAPIKDYRHRQATTISDFLDEAGHFRSNVETAGWLYPGGGQRHVAHNRSKLNEPPERALALMFAPVGVIFYIVRARSKGRKTRLAMVIPQINDLRENAEIRQILAAQGTLELTACSDNDAVLRMLATVNAHTIATETAASGEKQAMCRLMTFGIVDWNEKQKSRTHCRRVMSSNLKGLDNYYKAAAIFPNRWQTIKAKYDRKGNLVEPERSFVNTFSAREMISDNVANGVHWYYGLSDLLNNQDIRERLYFERKEISEMVKTATYEEECELLFIQLCHESWRRRMRKLGERAVNENARFSILVNKEAERLRASLSRCKNAETLRETVVDFWSRGGANELLRGDKLSKVLTLFGEKSWKKARDLALLALISYEPQSKDEAQALASTAEAQGDQDE